ncbi:MAG: hypothetical protein JW764_09140 [Chlorobiaceae bacterium]|nr:hypothetical protein [Chlorobiaceae bacterium]
MTSPETSGEISDTTTTFQLYFSMFISRKKFIAAQSRLPCPIPVLPRPADGNSAVALPGDIS